jgi:hypothetical protein
MSAERAAARIVRGVDRNEATIVFPFYGRVLWWLVMSLASCRRARGR